MPSREKSKKSRHDIRFERWRERLQVLLSFLCKTDEEQFTDERLRRLGIEVSDLDFFTGHSADSRQQYFTPSTDKVYQVQSSGVDSAEDDFSIYCRTNRRRVYGDSGLSEPLLRTFGQYRFALENVQPSPRRSMLNSSDSVKYGHWCTSGARGLWFQTRWAEELCPERSPHRQIEITIKDYCVEGRPSVAELEVLVSWMLGGMRAQRSNKSSSKGSSGAHAFKSHMIFPVLVISYVQPARVRVIQGYFDGTLKVQISKFIDFNVPLPAYVDAMNSLLRWGFATPSGNTTLKKSLPVISEGAEDAEEDVEISREDEETHVTRLEAPSGRLAENSPPSITASSG